MVPAKFRANYDKLTAKKTNASSSGEFTKSSFQMDAWQTDLIDNKNELIGINLIRSPGKSVAVENIYKEFYNIEENFKRKSFHRQIKDLVDSNKRVRSDKDLNNRQ